MSYVLCVHVAEYRCSYLVQVFSNGTNLNDARGILKSRSYKK